MYPTLQFAPPIADPGTLGTQPILKAAKTIASAQAATALRSFLHLNLDFPDDLPGLAEGRIHARESMFRNANQIWSTTQQPCLKLEHRRPADGSGTDTYYICLVFSDRSALVARRRPEEGGAGLYRVLPVVLRMPAALRPASGGPVALGIDTATWPENPDLLVDGAAFGPCDRLLIHHYDALPTEWARPVYSAGAPRHPRQDGVRAKLAAAIEGWGGAIDAAPFLADPGPGPVSGVLGRDIAAPRPELAGTPYAWPLAMARCNRNAAELEAVERFLYLAYVQLTGIHGHAIRDMLLTVSSPVPSQAGEKTRLDIDLRVVSAHRPRYGFLDSKDLKAVLLRDYTALLRSQRAPAGLRETVRTVQTYANAARTRTRLHGAALLHKRYTETPSAHDKLQAAALFGPPD